MGAVGSCHCGALESPPPPPFSKRLPGAEHPSSLPDFPKFPPDVRKSGTVFFPAFFFRTHPFTIAPSFFRPPQDVLFTPSRCTGPRQDPLFTLFPFFITSQFIGTDGTFSLTPFFPLRGHSSLSPSHLAALATFIGFRGHNVHVTPRCDLFTTFYLNAHPVSEARTFFLGCTQTLMMLPLSAQAAVHPSCPTSPRIAIRALSDIIGVSNPFLHSFCAVASNVPSRERKIESKRLHLRSGPHLLIRPERSLQDGTPPQGKLLFSARTPFLFFLFIAASNHAELPRNLLFPPSFSRIASAQFPKSI